MNRPEATSDLQAVVGRLPWLSYLLLLILAAVCPVFADGPRRLDDLSAQLKAGARQNEKSVVAIAVLINTSNDVDLKSDPFSERSGPSNGILPARIGVGAVIDIGNDAISILTLAHLIEPATRPRDRSSSAQIWVRFPLKANLKSLRATVIAADPRSDLAVLQVANQDITAELEQIKAVRFSDSLALQKGQLLLVTGNPWAISKDGSASIGIGMTTNLDRRQSESPQLPLMERTLLDLGALAEVDLPALLSASGTVLTSLDGDFAGLVTSLASPDGKISKTTYAIPMTPGFARLVDELSNGFEVQYGFLGVSSETTLPEELSGSGLEEDQKTASVVTRVSTNSPAERAGLQREDIILRVNDRIVRSSEDLVREIGLIPPEATVELLVLRRNKGVIRLDVELAKWPIYDDSHIVATASRHKAWRGIEVDYPTGRRRYLTDRYLTNFPQGVVISHVLNGSPAEAAGLRVGQFIVDVGPESVATPREFYDTVKNLTGDVRLKLHDDSEVTLGMYSASSQSPNP